MKIKGIELMQMIADGKIKDGTRIIHDDEEYLYDKRFNTLGIVGGHEDITEMLTFNELLNDDFEILEDKTEEIKEITINGRDVKYGSMYNWLGNCSIHEEKICSAIDTLAMKYNELVRAYNSLIKQQDTSKETNCMSD